MVDVKVLTEGEVRDLNIPSIMSGNNFADPDNYIVDTEQSGSVAQQDRDGRQIISYRQYKELSAKGSRLDNYAVRMYWPNRSGSWPIQASKYHKWFGLGYRPVGEVSEAAKVRMELRAEGMEETAESDRKFFECKTKYPTCERFFDSAKGLKTHWGRDHGEWSMKSKK